MTRDDPPLPPRAPGGGEVRSFRGSTGRDLRYRRVQADRERWRLLYLHGIESHGTWFLPAAYELRARGCTTFLVDRRGSGLNRDADEGDAPSAEVLLDDLRHLREEIGDPEIHVVGLSWGGKLAVAAALDRPERVRSLILVTPGLASLLDLAPWRKVLLVLGLLAGGRNRIKLPIEPEMFTRTPEYLEFIRGDRARVRRVTARFLKASRSLDRTVASRIAGVEVPVLLFLAGNDRIIDNPGVLRLLSGLPRGRLRVRLYEDATHSIQFDQRERMVEDIVHFLEETEKPC